MEWVNAVLQGLLLGGLYALLAAGLSLMFGVMRIVNLAHGVLAVGAAYIAWTLATRASIPPFVTLLIVVPVMFGVGYLLQLGVLNRALRMGSLAPILVTFGLAVVITNLLQEVYTVDNRSIEIGGLETASIQIAPNLAVGIFPLITFVVGVIVIVLLQLFLSRTRTGRAMRATSDDREAAPLMGIDNRKIYALATAIALGIVGIGGVFLGMKTQFNPSYGDVMLIFAFEAVIIGGLGSLWGTLLGGMILGVAQVVGAQAFPAYGLLFGNLVFLLVLAIRPQGLIPKAVNS